MFTDEVADKVLEAIKLGLSTADAARATGISNSLVYKWAKRDKAFGKKLRGAKLAGEAMLLKQIYDNEKGWQRFAWILERTRGDKYRVKQEAAQFDVKQYFRSDNPLDRAGLPPGAVPTLPQ